jgi:hypothetical protein
VIGWAFPFGSPENVPQVSSFGRDEKKPRL